MVWGGSGVCEKGWERYFHQFCNSLSLGARKSKIDFCSVRWAVTVWASTDSSSRLRQSLSRWIEASGAQGFSEDPAAPPGCLKVDLPCPRTPEGWALELPSWKFPGCLCRVFPSYQVYHPPPHTELCRPFEQTRRLPFELPRRLGDA